MNRSKVGRVIGLLAGGISAILVLAVLSFVNLAAKLGLQVNLPPTFLGLFGAAAVFGVIYAVFDKWVWRWPFVAKLLKLPNIAGTYECLGTTLGPPERVGTWTGEVKILQSWDRIRVRLDTKQSGSTSLIAALQWDDSDGYRLLYSYRNDPKVGEPELNSHRGFADLVFGFDLSRAQGEYFNGQSRFTFGRMELTRKHA